MRMTANTLSLQEAIAQRRSVRSFAAGPLDRGTIDQLLAAAVRAPTALHEEQWAFVIVQGRERLKALSDTVITMQGNVWREEMQMLAPHPAAAPENTFNLFYDAETLILICAHPMGAFVSADCWLAAENLILTATSLSLGTCVIGSAVSGLNVPSVKAELGIPPEVSVVVPIVVGVPAQCGTPSGRHPPVILNWLHAAT